MTGSRSLIIINRLSGCGEVWYRAWFGSKRPRVRIPPLRPLRNSPYRSVSALRRKLRRTGNFFVFRGEPASLGFAARRWGASAELPFGFSVRGSADIYSVSLLHVVVNCISFATTFFQKVTSHSFRRSSSPNATRCAGPGPKEIRVHR